MDSFFEGDVPQAAEVCPVAPAATMLERRSSSKDEPDSAREDRSAASIQSRSRHDQDEESEASKQKMDLGQEQPSKSTSRRSSFASATDDVHSTSEKHEASSRMDSKSHSKSSHRHTRRSSRDSQANLDHHRSQSRDSRKSSQRNSSRDQSERLRSPQSHRSDSTLADHSYSSDFTESEGRDKIAAPDSLKESSRPTSERSYASQERSQRSLHDESREQPTGGSQASLDKICSEKISSDSGRNQESRQDDEESRRSRSSSFADTASVRSDATAARSREQSRRSSRSSIRSQQGAATGRDEYQASHGQAVGDVAVDGDSLRSSTPKTFTPQGQRETEISHATVDSSTSCKRHANGVCEERTKAKSGSRASSAGSSKSRTKTPVPSLNLENNGKKKQRVNHNGRGEDDNPRDDGRGFHPYEGVPAPKPERRGSVSELSSPDSSHQQSRAGSVKYSVSSDPRGPVSEPVDPATLKENYVTEDEATTLTDRSFRSEQSQASYTHSIASEHSFSVHSHASARGHGNERRRKDKRYSASAGNRTPDQELRYDYSSDEFYHDSKSDISQEALGDPVPQQLSRRSSLGSVRSRQSNESVGSRGSRKDKGGMSSADAVTKRGKETENLQDSFHSDFSDEWKGCTQDEGKNLSNTDVCPAAAAGSENLDKSEGFIPQESSNSQAVLELSTDRTASRSASAGSHVLLQEEATGITPIVADAESRTDGTAVDRPSSRSDSARGRESLSGKPSSRAGSAVNRSSAHGIPPAGAKSASQPPSRAETPDGGAIQRSRSGSVASKISASENSQIESTASARPACEVRTADKPPRIGSAASRRSIYDTYPPQSSPASYPASLADSPRSQGTPERSVRVGSAASRGSYQGMPLQRTISPSGRAGSLDFSDAQDLEAKHAQAPSQSSLYDVYPAESCPASWPASLAGSPKTVASNQRAPRLGSAASRSSLYDTYPPENLPASYPASLDNVPISAGPMEKVSRPESVASRASLQDTYPAESSPASYPASLDNVPINEAAAERASRPDSVVSRTSVRDTYPAESSPASYPASLDNVPINEAAAERASRPGSVVSRTSMYDTYPAESSLASYPASLDNVPINEAAAEKASRPDSVVSRTSVHDTYPAESSPASYPASLAGSPKADKVSLRATRKGSSASRGSLCDTYPPENSPASWPASLAGSPKIQSPRDRPHPLESRLSRDSVFDSYPADGRPASKLSNQADGSITQIIGRDVGIARIGSAGSLSGLGEVRQRASSEAVVLSRPGSALSQSIQSPRDSLGQVECIVDVGVVGQGDAFKAGSRRSSHHSRVSSLADDIGPLAQSTARTETKTANRPASALSRGSAQDSPRIAADVNSRREIVFSQSEYEVSEPATFQGGLENTEAPKRAENGMASTDKNAKDVLSEQQCGDALVQRDEASKSLDEPRHSESAYYSRPSSDSSDIRPDAMDSPMSTRRENAKSPTADEKPDEPDQSTQRKTSRPTSSSSATSNKSTSSQQAEGIKLDMKAIESKKSSRRGSHASTSSDKGNAATVTQASEALPTAPSDAVPVECTTQAREGALGRRGSAASIGSAKSDTPSLVIAFPGERPSSRSSGVPGRKSSLETSAKGPSSAQSSRQASVSSLKSATEDTAETYRRRESVSSQKSLTDRRDDGQKSDKKEEKKGRHSCSSSTASVQSVELSSIKAQTCSLTEPFQPVPQARPTGVQEVKQSSPVDHFDPSSESPQVTQGSPKMSSRPSSAQKNIEIVCGETTVGPAIEDAAALTPTAADSPSTMRALSTGSLKTPPEEPESASVIVESPGHAQPTDLSSIYKEAPTESLSGKGYPDAILTVEEQETTVSEAAKPANGAVDENVLSSTPAPATAQSIEDLPPASSDQIAEKVSPSGNDFELTPLPVDAKAGTESSLSTDLSSEKANEAPVRETQDTAAKFENASVELPSASETILNEKEGATDSVPDLVSSRPVEPTVQTAEEAPKVKDIPDNQTEKVIEEQPISTVDSQSSPDDVVGQRADGQISDEQPSNAQDSTENQLVSKEPASSPNGSVASVREVATESTSQHGAATVPSAQSMGLHSMEGASAPESSQTVVRASSPPSSSEHFHQESVETESGSSKERPNQVIDKSVLEASQVPSLPTLASCQESNASEAAYEPLPNPAVYLSRRESELLESSQSGKKAHVEKSSSRSASVSSESPLKLPDNFSDIPSCMVFVGEIEKVKEEKKEKPLSRPGSSASQTSLKATPAPASHLPAAEALPSDAGAPTPPQPSSPPESPVQKPPRRTASVSSHSSQHTSDGIIMVTEKRSESFGQARISSAGSTRSVTSCSPVAVDQKFPSADNGTCVTQKPPSRKGSAGSTGMGSSPPTPRIINVAESPRSQSLTDTKPPSGRAAKTDRRLGSAGSRSSSAGTNGNTAAVKARPPSTGSKSSDRESDHAAIKQSSRPGSATSQFSVSPKEERVQQTNLLKDAEIEKTSERRGSNSSQLSIKAVADVPPGVIVVAESPRGSRHSSLGSRSSLREETGRAGGRRTSSGSLTSAAPPPSMQSPHGASSNTVGKGPEEIPKDVIVVEEAKTLPASGSRPSSAGSHASAQEQRESKPSSRRGSRSSQASLVQQGNGSEGLTVVGDVVIEASELITRSRSADSQTKMKSSSDKPPSWKDSLQENERPPLNRSEAVFTMDSGSSEMATTTKSTALAAESVASTTTDGLVIDFQSSAGEKDIANKDSEPTELKKSSRPPSGSSLKGSKHRSSRHGSVSSQKSVLDSSRKSPDVATTPPASDQAAVEAGSGRMSALSPQETTRSPSNSSEVPGTGVLCPHPSRAGSVVEPSSMIVDLTKVAEKLSQQGSLPGSRSHSRQNSTSSHRSRDGGSSPRSPPSVFEPLPKAAVYIAPRESAPRTEKSPPASPATSSPVIAPQPKHSDDVPRDRSTSSPPSASQVAVDTELSMHQNKKTSSTTGSVSSAQSASGVIMATMENPVPPEVETDADVDGYSAKRSSVYSRGAGSETSSARGLDIDTTVPSAIPDGDSMNEPRKLRRRPFVSASCSVSAESSQSDMSASVQVQDDNSASEPLFDV